MTDHAIDIILLCLLLLALHIALVFLLLGLLL
jgi:hypothetical protein